MSRPAKLVIHMSPPALAMASAPGPAPVTSTIRFPSGSMRVSVLCCFSATQTIPSGPAAPSAGVPGTGIAATTCFADGSKRTANPSAVVVQSEPPMVERKPGPL
jgi:hypothetical protein